MNMAEAPSTKTTHTVISDGCHLSINLRDRDVSHGPTVVLVHHWGGSPRLFEPFLRQPGITSLRTIAYHARGWHPSTGPKPEDPSKYGIPEMASDLEQVIATMTAEHVSRGLVVVAHSMGAKVAQYYAATCPPIQKRMLKGLVLVAPAPLGGLSVPESVKEQQLAAYDDAKNAEAGIRHVLLARTDALGDGTIKQMVEDAMRGSPEATRAWPTYGSSSDFAHLQKDISVPVLVLRGDKDWERKYVGPMGEHQGWANVTVDDCGHMIALEQPTVLAEQVRAFVDEQKL